MCSATSTERFDDLFVCDLFHKSLLAAWHALIRPHLCNHTRHTRARSYTLGALPIQCRPHSNPPHPSSMLPFKPHHLQQRQHAPFSSHSTPPHATHVHSKIRHPRSTHSTASATKQPGSSSSSWLQQVTAGSLAAVLAAVQLSATEPAWAVLSSPNARIPRTAEAALRRWRMRKQAPQQPQHARQHCIPDAALSRLVQVHPRIQSACRHHPEDPGKHRLPAAHPPAQTLGKHGFGRGHCAGSVRKQGPAARRWAAGGFAGTDGPCLLLLSHTVKGRGSSQAGWPR